jgi:hypothetical protein
MLETLLYGMTMLAFGWLVVWLVTDRSKPSKTWWPFDYRDGDAKPVDEAAPKGTGQWNRQKPTTPWKPSGF